MPTALASLLVLVGALQASQAFLRDFRTFSKNVTLTLDALLANNRYDKRIRPDFGGLPTVVTVNMYIKSMGPVSETDMMYTMDVYFRQSWVDSRLSYQLPGLDEFSMSWLFLDKVWKPDTFFVNGKKSHLHRITSPNKFLRIRNDGFLTYSMRLTISATCRMYLRKFPMDTQSCPLLIGSYGYTSRDVQYQWTPGGGEVGLEPGVELAQYFLANISTISKLTTVRGKEEFSIIQANFMLQRTMGYFVLQMYVPCALIVCCSWVSFWINPSDAPARVCLGATTALSLTTLGFVGRQALPKVSYATALDWFVILCFTFVFAAIAEYAVINFIDKITKDIKQLLEERAKAKEVAVNTVVVADIKDTEGVDGGYLGLKGEAMMEPLVLSDITMADGSSLIGAQHQYQQEDGVCKEDDHSEATLSSGRKLHHRRRYSLPTITVTRHDSSSDSELDLRDQDIRYFNKGTVQLGVEVVMGESVIQVEGEEEAAHALLRARRAGRGSSLRRTLLVPGRLWRSVHILPREQDVTQAILDNRAPEKFTRIDIVSRRVFPLSFSFLLTAYFLFYSYYVNDEQEQFRN